MYESILVLHVGIKNYNSCFSTVADKIGHNVVYDPSTHPSIVEIKNHVDIDNNFGFQNITAERVEKIINTINIEKATGADNIPAKVVKQCKVPFHILLKK
jgi:hypothetical protein